MEQLSVQENDLVKVKESEVVDRLNVLENEFGFSGLDWKKTMRSLKLEFPSFFFANLPEMK